MAARESYTSDTLEFRGQLTKLINATPDAIHVAAQSESSGGTIVKQLQELGYGGPIYAESVVSGTTALEIAGDAADGLKAVIPNPDLDTERGKAFWEAFRARYGYVTLPWFLGSAYDDVYIAAECLKMTGDDQDADGFRDCLYDITWSGAIGDGYTFDEKGEVVGPPIERASSRRGRCPARTSMYAGFLVAPNLPPAAELPARTAHGDLQPAGQHPAIVGADGPVGIAVRGGRQHDCHRAVTVR